MMLSLYGAALILAQAAQSERLHVEWVAPEGCPDQSTLAASLESSVPRRSTFSASVRVNAPQEGTEPSNGAWRAVVETTASDGKRTRVVEASDCERVTEAAVLVVTLAATVLQQEEDFRRDGGVFHEPVPPVEPRKTQTHFAGDRPFKVDLRLQPVVSGSAGIFPLPALSLGLAFSLVRSWFRGEVAFLSALESRTPEAVRGARFNLASLKFRGCYVFEPRKELEIGPCLGGELGSLAAEASGVTRSARQTVWWGAALGGITGGIRGSDRIFPRATLEVGVNLVRPTFFVGTPTENITVHQMSLFMARLTVGVEIHIQ